MKEDIKILEKLIKETKGMIEEINDINNIQTYAFPIDYEEIQALENIIARYKELERKLTPTPDNAVPLEYQTMMYVDKRGYVSKEKIQEKIEELNNKDLEIYDTDSEDVIIAKYEERAVLDFCNSILED